jgi:hypothetical protein
VRQLRDLKGSALIETMPPARLTRYAEVYGITLARAHARSGRAAKAEAIGQGFGEPLV